MQLKLKIHSLLAVCLLLPGLGFAQAPDRILYNGKVLTVDRDFSVASAIAIRGERILAVGETDEIRPLAGDDTEEIDLEGRTVIPGLIDNHIHYLRATNFAAYETRIHGVTSRREVMARISSRAKELGPGRWIFILGGWSEQQFADEPGGFTREELDEAAPDNPVFIQRTYSTFYMNSLAVDQIAPAIPELYEGGSVVRTNSQDGRTVMNAALKHFPFAETLEERKDEVRAFNDYLTSMGVTMVYDAGYLDGSYEPVEALYEAGELSLRVFYAARYWADSPRTAIAAAEMLDREDPFQRDERFGMFGIGEHVYGLLHDSPRSDVPFSEDIYAAWRTIIRAAARNGWYVNEHAMQGSTAARMIEISEEVSKEYPIGDLRWSLGHANRVSEETVQRARDLGWNITLTNHTLSGQLRVEGRPSPPIRMIQDSGILWGLGSDGTIVATYNPFHALWEYTSGKVFPDRVKFEADEVLTREEALIAHTRSNAYILFMEDDLGTLEAGKLADLVVLDRDYLTVPANEIREIRPVMTMVGGEVVHEAAD